jgi:hypothetical protein
MDCKINDQRALDMRRHLAYRYIKSYYGREPSEDEIVAHADWIDRDSAGSNNYQGMADWTVDQLKGSEFWSKFQTKVEYDKLYEENKKLKSENEHLQAEINAYADKLTTCENSLELCEAKECVCPDPGPTVIIKEVCEGHDARHLFWNLWWVK